ncbi:hypothetical protein [Roseibium litorale]|uniref:hypothetical protein n=1 Tax=Roseibium litorale TaxID=2803841 RepID=UPI0017845621|nr:hypothetical protein [Roseibium litorale]
MFFIDNFLIEPLAPIQALQGVPSDRSGTIGVPQAFKPFPPLDGFDKEVFALPEVWQLSKLSIEIDQPDMPAVPYSARNKLPVFPKCQLNGDPFGQKRLFTPLRRGFNRPVCLRELLAHVATSRKANTDDRPNGCPRPTQQAVCRFVQDFRLKLGQLSANLIEIEPRIVDRNFPET